LKHGVHVLQRTPDLDSSHPAAILVYSPHSAAVYSSDKKIEQDATVWEDNRPGWHSWERVRYWMGPVTSHRPSA